jgi:hypothetical protein
MNTNTINTRDTHDETAVLLSFEQLHAVSGGIEKFPDVSNPLYVKILGHWVPTGTEPFIPVDLDGKHTPK